MVWREVLFRTGEPIAHIKPFYGDQTEMIRSMVKAALAAAALAGAAAAEADPGLWLEDVEGEKALDWARAQNARSLAELEADPRFSAMHEEAKAILTSTARIPFGRIHGGAVYNFWQDESHVRGLWRRADALSYRAGAPEWETLIDYDKLAADEARNWVAGSTVCLEPDFVHCMVELSDGGKDAGFWREFNTETKAFVDGGFALDEAKSSLAWVDEGALLVGSDMGEGSLTESGYPRTLRMWRRGEDLPASKLWFEGETKDVAVQPRVEHVDGRTYLFAERAVSFFETEFYYASGADGELARLDIPLNADLHGVFKGGLNAPAAIFFLREAFTPTGSASAIPQGSIVAYDLEGGTVAALMEAADNQSIEDIGIGENDIVVQYLEDVSGKAARLTARREGLARRCCVWKRDEIGLPAKSVVKIRSAGGGTDDAMLSIESLTRPNSLLYVTARNKVETIAETPAFYDASVVVVEQRFATSKDGTKIPYFIMGKASVLKQGNAPTIQYGYGGFLAAALPVYYEDPARPQHGALAGKIWAARGGVLVLSNIRGGSEYGPRWHQAALKEKRQNAYDDFIAISEDLIRTGVTSPEKLGAMGRSNGGLLMGVMLTERPDLYAALDIGAPLFDMKRYNKLLAGASWMGEYGNPDIPDEWAYISQYSPYQNLKPGKPYPKVFFYTSTKDDRVHPGHARKAAARLAGLGYDFYYYENIEGGHGGTSNQDQLAYRTALEYVYFAKMLMGEDDGDTGP